MEQFKFTIGRVREIPHPPKGQVMYWDPGTRGLGIRATPTAKVYIFQGRLNSKTIRVKIGDVRTWPLDSNDAHKPGARQEARRLQSLLDKGVDPRNEKQDRLAKQEAQRAEITRHTILVIDVWAEYLETQKHRWSTRHYDDHVQLAHLGGEKRKRGKGKTIPGALAALMPLKLADLTPEIIKSWITKEAAQRSAQARLAFALIRAFVNWCEDQVNYKGLCDLSAFSGRIKKDALPRPSAKSDALQREQLKPWFAAVNSLPNPVISAYLQVLLLTGARRQEVLSLQWDDVDFRWKSMSIRDKVDGTRVIPLTPNVAALLNRLPRRNKWVFSSPRSKSGRLQEPRKAHNQALAKAGIEHLTIHGLRRSFGTLAEWVESPVGIVYQIQGHKPSATAEKHYRKRHLDLLRVWHEKIESWILNEAGIQQPSKPEDMPVLRVIEGGRG